MHAKKLFKKVLQSHGRLALHRMAKFGLLLILLLAETLMAEEDPEPIFRAASGELEMGYCFGVDYIALYKLTETERQLLGNSSNPVFAPPEAYRERVSPTSQTNELLGMQVEDLKLSDSGIYLRECWRHNKLVKHQKYYLYVCDEEVSSQEILVGSDGGADLVCNFSGRTNVTIRWFNEANVAYKTSLFLDTKKSLEPLQKELKGVIQVLDKGFSLHLSANGLKNNSNFYCLVMEGEQCKAFQNIFMPDSSEFEMLPVFHGVGERVVLPCPSEHLSERYWETPFGHVTETTPSKIKGSIASEMYISKNEEPDDYSLVIPSITLNHSGEYSCSTAEYFISVCTELKTNTIQINPGDKVTLHCNTTTDESTNIQWYRKTGLEEDLLIYDSRDTSPYIVANFHFSDHSLTITELSMNDSGTYWCVLLLDDFTDSTEEIPEDEDESDEYDWLGENENSDKCIFKQVTLLNVLSRKNSRITTDSTPERDFESGILQYAVIVGVAVLVVVLLTVVIVVVLRAKKKAPEQSRPDPSAKQIESAVSEPFIPLKSVS